MKPVYPAPRALPSYENLLLEMVEPNILKVTLNRPKAYNADVVVLVNQPLGQVGQVLNQAVGQSVVWRRRG